MSIVDIEKGIKNKNIGSKFRIVAMASQRAREIMNPKENTLSVQDKRFLKPTTIALAEIVENRIQVHIVNE
ncbi:MAG: DNA-directed RNA polymerase subunit omega [Calditerrivibrio sp.]|nr:DNA-directed RNA polymerase subunit omega [Calditerrivibrio sp.]MCA1932852.1 DNA-directed RNA polymerase subunit omega [Calditerrivibrio sp.]